MSWRYTRKVAIPEFLVDLHPTGTPTGPVPQGRRLGLWRAFKRRMAKMNSVHKGSLLVGPGVAAAIRGEESTVRGPKKWFRGPLDTYRSAFWCFGGTLGNPQKNNFLVVFDPTGTPSQAGTPGSPFEPMARF